MGLARSAASGAELLEEVLTLGRRIRVELSRHGLTMRQFQAMRALAGGPLRIGQLADAVEVRAPSAVTLVDGLVSAGLVERRPDPDDARASRVALTQRGRRTLRTAQAHVTDRLERELAARA